MTKKIFCKDCKYFEEIAHYPLCKNTELLLEDDGTAKAVGYSTKEYLFITTGKTNNDNKCKHFKQPSWNFLK